MTAEFAAVIPAVVLVLVFALGALQLAGEQLRLQDVAAAAARELGRGDPIDVTLVQQSVPGVVITSNAPGQLVCAQARAPAAFGVLSAIELSATSCALADGL